MNASYDLKSIQDKIANIERQRAELYLTKTEIARTQIDSAIRCYLSNYSRVAVSTLIFPAFQIVRDLNRGRRDSLAQAFTDICADSGVNPSLFWKEMNKGAATIKHANEGDVIVDVNNFCRDIEGAILFSVHEYSNLNDGKISPAMSIFSKAIAGNKDWNVSCFRRCALRWRLNLVEFYVSVRTKKGLLVAKILLKAVQVLDNRKFRREYLRSRKGAGTVGDPK